MKKYDDDLEFGSLNEDSRDSRFILPIIIVAVLLVIVIAALVLIGKNGKNKDTSADPMATEQSETTEAEAQTTEVMGTIEATESAEEADADDPQGSNMGNETGASVDVTALLSAGSVAESGETTFGIDVARYQGTIDWSQVAASGVQFAMIRVGYRTQKTGEIVADSNAKYNMQEAQANGIKIGAYFFSTAVTTDEAVQEADWVADYISQYQITYPVAFNCEGFENADSRQYAMTQSESFRYPGTADDILKNVSLDFKIGQKMALVGRNGAGKTTLIKLLLRLYEPTEGEICLNGINIEKYDYEEYLQIFSVVFQDFKLFAFPLDENIAAGGQVDKRRLKQVLTKIGLNEFVEGLPKKECTLLYQENGEGVTPSGGEAQKVAIARALYKDAPFVILDEPTAALDPIAEAGIYENFDSLVGEKTAVYISHRMSSCKFCDRIVVLDHGEIAEEGTHDSLMERNGIYAKLYQKQAEYYVTAHK